MSCAPRMPSGSSNWLSLFTLNPFLCFRLFHGLVFHRWAVSTGPRLPVRSSRRRQRTSSPPHHFFFSCTAPVLDSFSCSPGRQVPPFMPESVPSYGGLENDSPSSLMVAFLSKEFPYVQPPGLDPPRFYYPSPTCSLFLLLFPASSPLEAFVLLFSSLIDQVTCTMLFSLR